MPGKFYPPPIFHQLDLGRRADSRWALPQISSFFCKKDRLTSTISSNLYLATLRQKSSLNRSLFLKSVTPTLLLELYRMSYYTFDICNGLLNYLFNSSKVLKCKLDTDIQSDWSSQISVENGAAYFQNIII